MKKNIAWDEDLALNIPEIDKLQKKVFDHISLLSDARKNKVEPKEAIDTLMNFADFLRFFFKKEETYMMRYNYPEHKLHMKEHRQILKKILVFKKIIAEDYKLFNEDSIKAILEITREHIKTLDKRYAPFIRLKLFILDSQKQ